MWLEKRGKGERAFATFSKNLPLPEIPPGGSTLSAFEEEEEKRKGVAATFTLPFFPLISPPALLSHPKKLGKYNWERVGRKD